MIDMFPHFHGDYWKHRKGGYYQRYFEMGKHSETLEPMIVYRSVKVDPNEEEVWVRPASMWDEVDENDQPRFVPIDVGIDSPDFAVVMYYRLKCPMISCGEVQVGLGKFATQLRARQAVAEAQFCEWCGHQVEMDEWHNMDGPAGWVDQVSSYLLTPLAAREMLGVK